MFFGKKQTEFMSHPPMAGVPTSHQGYDPNQYSAMAGMQAPGLPYGQSQYAGMAGMPTPGMPYEGMDYENYGVAHDGMVATHSHMGYTCDACGYCTPYYECSTVVDKMPQIYVVKKGDSVYKIAKKYGLDWRELAGYNRLGNPDLIYPGERLFIPPRY